jgi:hypothetical protein
MCLVIHRVLHIKQGGVLKSLSNKFKEPERNLFGRAIIFNRVGPSEVLDH